MYKNSFYTWLQQFRDDDSPVGDLARDSKGDNKYYGFLFDDSGFPRYSRDKKKIEEHLTISRNTSYECLKVFNYAFHHYQKYLSNIKEFDK